MILCGSETLWREYTATRNNAGVVPHTPTRDRAVEVRLFGALLSQIATGSRLGLSFRDR